MRKLIEVHQKDLIVCDNANCDYKIPYVEGSEQLLKYWINAPCPNCGENLLTEKITSKAKK